MGTSDRVVFTHFRRVGSDFLKTDLQTGLIFSDIALQTTDVAKRQRTTQIARRAYDAISRFLPRIRLTREDARVVAHNLERLKYELLELGETFNSAAEL